MKSKYSISVIASALILTMVLSSFMPVMAQVPAFAPMLSVTTIPQDDQARKTGIIILGLVPTAGWDKGYSPEPGQGLTTNVAKLWSSNKIVVTYNGLTLFWQIGTAGPVITCDVQQKDKANPVPNKFGVPSKQFPQENLMTTLTDVSAYFICKPRWVTPANMPGWYESVGVLDVYYMGPLVPTVIADNILIVTADLVIGRATLWGTDMQDICVLGWSMASNDQFMTLPDHGALVWVSTNALGPFVGCEQAALEQRLNQGVPIAASSVG